MCHCFLNGEINRLSENKSNLKGAVSPILCHFESCINGNLNWFTKDTPK